MDIYGNAHYDLNEIQQLLNDPNTRIITRNSFREAVKLGYAGESDMELSFLSKKKLSIRSMLCIKTEIFVLYAEKEL